MDSQDILTRMQFTEYQRIIEKDILRDPYKRDSYLQNKKKAQKVDAYVDWYINRICVVH